MPSSSTTETPANGSFALADLVRVSHERWRIIVTAMLCTVAVALLVVTLWPSKYSASATVVLEGRKNNITDLSAVLSQLPTDPSSVQNQIQILQSRDLASQVVDRMGLANDPEFNPALSPGLFSALLPAPSGTAHDIVIANFLKHLSAQALGLSTAISISFTSKDPAKAARIVNTIVDTYIDQQIELKFQASRETTDWLANRIHQLALQVQAAESNVQAYKAEHGLTDAANGAPLINEQVSAINTQLVQAKSDLAEKQAVDSRIKGLVAQGHAADVAQIVSSPLIVQLREQEATAIQNESQLAVKYGPKNPKLIAAQNQQRDLDRKIGQEVDRLTGSADNDVAVARAQVGSLGASLRDAEDQSTDENMARVKLAALQSNAASTRAEYEAFVTRLREAQDQDAVDNSDARVISHADMPSAPSSPPRLLITLASIPAGFLLGLLFALMAERGGVPVVVVQSSAPPASDPLHGYPVLAEVPRATSWHAANELVHHPNSPYSLAVKGLAQRAAYPAMGARPRVVTIASARSGEAKSALTVNFARACAHLGQRVVVVDGDLVSPMATRLMGLKPPASGVAEVVSGAAPLSQSLMRDPCSTAFVLSPATRPANPGQVLSSPRLGKLFEHLRHGADLVVIDAPGVSRETAILASLSDAVLFVASAEAPSGYVGRAIETLAAMRAPALGIVVAHQ
ncbi:MAG: polysaccharide biosynthesis tyrosine autokinase [Rhizomicrobium sp.]